MITLIEKNIHYFFNVPYEEIIIKDVQLGKALLTVVDSEGFHQIEGDLETLNNLFFELYSNDTTITLHHHSDKGVYLFKYVYKELTTYLNSYNITLKQLINFLNENGNRELADELPTRLRNKIPIIREFSHSNSQTKDRIFSLPLNIKLPTEYVYKFYNNENGIDLNMLNLSDFETDYTYLNSILDGNIELLKNYTYIYVSSHKIRILNHIQPLKKDLTYTT